MSTKRPRFFLQISLIPLMVGFFFFFPSFRPVLVIFRLFLLPGIMIVIAIVIKSLVV